MNKKLLTAVSLGLVSSLTIAGTMTYLTSTDADTNTMTMGNVKIEQLEYERAVDADGNWIENNNKDHVNNDIPEKYTPDLLKDFTQNKPLYPAVFQDGVYKWDDRNGSQKPSGEGSHQQTWLQVGAPGANQLFDASMKNVQDKFVFVKNTGNNNVYYRTIIAIEHPEGIDDTRFNRMVSLNVNSNYRFDWDDETEGAQGGEDGIKSCGVTKINGTRYTLYEVTYTETLGPKEVSRPSLLQVYLYPDTTSEEVALFGDELNILVTSQAVQADGFKGISASDEYKGLKKYDANIALDEAFGDIDANNHPWSDTSSDNNGETTTR